MWAVVLRGRGPRGRAVGRRRTLLPPWCWLSPSRCCLIPVKATSRAGRPGGSGSGPHRHPHPRLHPHPRRHPHPHPRGVSRSRSGCGRRAGRPWQEQGQDWRWPGGWRVPSACHSSGQGVQRARPLDGGWGEHRQRRVPGPGSAPTLAFLLRSLCPRGARGSSVKCLLGSGHDPRVLGSPLCGAPGLPLPCLPLTLLVLSVSLSLSLSCQINR